MVEPTRTINLYRGTWATQGRAHLGDGAHCLVKLSPGTTSGFARSMGNSKFAVGILSSKRTARLTVADLIGSCPANLEQSDCKERTNCEIISFQITFLEMSNITTFYWTFLRFAVNFLYVYYFTLLFGKSDLWQNFARICIRFSILLQTPYSHYPWNLKQNVIWKICLLH